jgi:hypothetical protein
MEKHEDVTSILSKLNLHDIEQTISQPYHKTGPGKPPRSPLGIFKALIVKQLKSIPSDRELYAGSGTMKILGRYATSRSVRSPTTHPR